MIELIIGIILGCIGGGFSVGLLAGTEISRLQKKLQLSEAIVKVKDLESGEAECQTD